MTAKVREDSDAQNGAGAAEPEAFGHYLSRQRELRGISLSQIAEQTRIGVANLRALEQDQRERLPARVFLVGHIRAYALAIGLNPDEAVLRYDEAQQCLPPIEPKAAAGRIPRRRVAAALVATALFLSAAAWFLSR